MPDDDAFSNGSNNGDFEKIASIIPLYDKDRNIIDFRTEGNLNESFRNADISRLTDQEDEKTQSDI